MLLCKRILYFMQKDAIYILGAYDFECFDFLLRTFAIEMKDDCLYYVKEQLEKLTKTVFLSVYAWHTCIIYDLCDILCRNQLSQTWSK